MTQQDQGEIALWEDQGLCWKPDVMSLEPSPNPEHHEAHPTANGARHYQNTDVRVLITSCRGLYEGPKLGLRVVLLHWADCSLFLDRGWMDGQPELRSTVVYFCMRQMTHDYFLSLIIRETPPYLM